jgi:hypothetical protein
MRPRYQRVISFHTFPYNVFPCYVLIDTKRELS